MRLVISVSDAVIKLAMLKKSTVLCMKMSLIKTLTNTVVGHASALKCKVLIKSCDFVLLSKQRISLPRCRANV